MLEQAGVPEQTATAALTQADRKLYVRDGKRFLPLDGGQDVQGLPGIVRPALNGCNGTNGTAGTDGHDGAA